MTIQISVIIPCKNELPNIEACINSVVPIADELIVADSGSTDGTLELVKARKDCRVIEREYVCSANLKNWAIGQVTHEWVVVVDADEMLSAELIKEITEFKQQNQPDKSFHAYWMSRENYFLGQRIRFSGWKNDRVRRLFRSSCRYDERRVHAELDVTESQTGQLENPIIHNTFRTFDHFMAKNQRYARWGAEEMLKKGRSCTIFQLLFRPSFRFFRQYVLQRGFLDGKAGLIISGVAASYVFSKLANLWELERLEAENTLKIEGNQTVPFAPQSEIRKAG